MSSLRPANIWTGSGKSKGTKEITPGWYSTKNMGLTFLPEWEQRPVAIKNWYNSAIYWARRDPNVFIELVMDPDAGGDSEFIKQSWFHREMNILMDKGSPLYSPKQREPFLFLAFAWPRGFGKTTQVIGSILYTLGKYPNTRIKLVAETKEIAGQRVYEVKSHIERNAYLKAVFPHLQGTAKDQWTNSKIYIQREMISRDPSLMASGILEAATGGRADLIIGDDVVGRRNALTQSKLREEVKSTWWSTWFPQLVKGGRCWYIFTPWHLQDLSHEIVTKKEFITFPVYVGQNFETPWPEYYSQEAMQKKFEIMGPIEFARAYWLEAVNESDAPIDENYKEYIDAENVDGDGWQFLLSLDLAVGGKTRGKNKEPTGDEFAAVVFAVNRTQKKAVVVDTETTRGDILKQIRVVLNCVWNIPRIGLSLKE